MKLAPTGIDGGNSTHWLTIFVLSNGLDQVNIDIYIRTLIAGLILLAALLINHYALRLRSVAVEVE
jgi:ribose/xylose/arabinose/galactoside ABC-type transport system permease subunit